MALKRVLVGWFLPALNLLVAHTAATWTRVTKRQPKSINLTVLIAVHIHPGRKFLNHSIPLCFVDHPISSEFCWSSRQRRNSLPITHRYPEFTNCIVNISFKNVIIFNSYHFNGIFHEKVEENTTISLHSYCCRRWLNKLLTIKADDIRPSDVLKNPNGRKFEIVNNGTTLIHRVNKNKFALIFCIFIYFKMKNLNRRMFQNKKKRVRSNFSLIFRCPKFECAIEWWSDNVLWIRRNINAHNLSIVALKCF